MIKLRKSAASASIALMISMLVTPVLGQTRVSAPKNSIDIRKDVELGRQAANEAERQLPLLNDSEVQRYVDRVGRRLAEAIPPEFQHREFQYSFKVVNASDINAFALPGGFTYVNRGLIEAARNEGELAGVVAHEISHVALRHGTAQYAKAQKAGWGQAAGQILGAIIGGGVGTVIAAGSQLGIGAYFLKYSRDYEKQADLLGSQIMARAGYDPRDLANMFRTIEQESQGRGGPEWLSSHPNPGNRFEYINREADMLRVSDPIRNTPEFSDARARLRDMPRARSMEEISRAGGRNTSGGRPVGGRVEAPSRSMRTYNAGNVFSVSVPSNWRELQSSDSVTYAPEGAYGEVQGSFVFTHGAQIGVAQSSGRNLRSATDQFVQSLAQNNPNLRRQSNYRRVSIDGREGLTMALTNVSDLTGRTENIWIATTQLRNGDIVYLIGVAPQNEFSYYQSAFNNILNSLRING
ncbi:MAG TPA: M48 family metallopeptidase [Blastocatellia bacterium]|nr:M48 family metallopeptidase [Blastocatellia bacterium]